VRELFPKSIVLGCALFAFAMLDSASSAADTVGECIGANERSIDLRKQGHFLAARRELAVCAASACPDVIQQVCAKRMAEVNDAMPSLVFDVKNGAGQPMTEVQIAIDGQPALAASATAVAVDPGRHTIRFEAPEQPPFEETVVVLEGERHKQVTAVLGPRVEQAPLGRIVVSTDSAATVKVDDKETTGGRFDASLAVGSHEVSVSEPGKVPYRTEIEIRAGETRMLSLSLMDEKRSGGTLWPWIVGGVAVAAGATVGGYFLFKPQDVTTTSVPAGKTATVQLSLGTGR
jgi:hypothetical protein